MRGVHFRCLHRRRRHLQAITFSEYGGPGVLTMSEVPGPGQVRVAVRAAGVNPTDWKFRSGALRDMVPLPLPHTPGLEVAGIVDAVGPGAGLSVGRAGRTAHAAWAAPTTARPMCVPEVSRAPCRARPARAACVA